MNVDFYLLQCNEVLAKRYKSRFYGRCEGQNARMGHEW